MAPGQAIVTSAGKSGLCNFTFCSLDCKIMKYTGRCESTTTTPEPTTSTVVTTTPEPTTSTVVTVTPKATGTTTCSCHTDGRKMAPGQAIVTSAGKSGLCNFTLCTVDCEIMKYSGRCESTTTTPEPTTSTVVSVTPKTTGTTTCSCHADGRQLSPGQATVTSAGKPDLCNYFLCTENCKLLKETGRCEVTTSQIPTHNTTTITTVFPMTSSTTPSLWDCCMYHGRVLTPGQVIVTSDDKSGQCTYVQCTSGCKIMTSSRQCDTTSPITASSTAKSTTVETTTLSSPATSSCFCKVNGKLILPGKKIYHTSDKAGWCYFGLCSKTCEIVKHMIPCVTSTSSPPATESPVPTTAPSSCSALHPPRAMNETWKIDNCTIGMCTGNNTVSVVPMKCPKVKPVTCQNGLQPSKTYDQSGCCYQNHCDCFCSGWAGSHYRTFDGTDYIFQGNCTYILVKQITEKIKNFKIYIDNINTEPDMTWPRAIKIIYKSWEITLVRVTVNNSEKIKALVNDQEIIQPYFHDGIRISSSGITEKVEIIAINATITFDGLEFTIDLPYKLFEGNVEGQCGSCTNNKTDDCKFPDGTIASSCSDSAPHWKVTDKNKTFCETGATTPVPIHRSTTLPAESTFSPITVSPSPCAVSNICTIIYGPIFSKCHDTVPPGPYYDACVYDGCHARNDTIICSSIAMYAKMCKSKGDVCVNWRDHTNGTCVYHCPGTMEYKSCASKEQPTCSLRHTDSNDNSGVDEGCFCPDGKFLYTPSDICTDSCDCIGPDGKPRQVGETWQSNCQDCSCNNVTLSVVCKPHKCPPSPSVICNEQGYVPVVQRNEHDLCCTETKCKCNVTHCPAVKPLCKTGYAPVIHMHEGRCCPEYTCEPNAVCVYNDTEYKPGMIVPQDTCKNCKCTDKVDPSTKHNIIECTAVKCDTYCAKGFEYKMKEGQCCGNCTQVSCIIDVPNKPPIILQPGKKMADGKNNCTMYECEKIKGHFIPNIYNQWCPPLDYDNCEPGTIHMDSDGCCQTCTPKECSVTKNITYITHQGCQSKQEVPMISCGGRCMTSSVYSAEANMISHKCSCCQELETSKKNITLLCPGGATTEFTYTYVTKCGCVSTKCEPLTKQMAVPQG